MSAEGATVRSRKKKTIPATKVSMSVACKNLRDADLLSKSDPMVVLYTREFKDQRWREVDRTETIDNTLNPEFVHRFKLDYYFETRQYMRFEVYDIDSKTTDLSKQDALGCMECALGVMVSCIRIEKPLEAFRGQKARGTITVLTEQQEGTKEEITMQWAGRELDKKDTFGKSDPFLEFCRQDADGGYTVVHRTEFIKVNLNPDWKPLRISVQDLCNGDYKRNIKVKCYDWNRRGNHSFIGEFETTLNKITTGPGKQNEYTLHNEKMAAKKKKTSYQGSGRIVLVNQAIRTSHSFLDYIQNGTQIQVTVAIDFSASNGDPHDAGSLHYLHSTHLNHYARALLAVVEILEDYDSDKRIPGFGFGAKHPESSTVMDMFPLNDNLADPECEGTQGILDQYKRTLEKVKNGQMELYGPSHFAPIISHAAHEAQKKMDGSLYHILLILTDGEVNDMRKTIDTIIDASYLPLSIVIVGIGDEPDNFEAMKILDGDYEALKSFNKVARRDIVQFVELRNFEGGSSSEAFERTHIALANAVLEEVPGQVCSFMRSKSIHPKMSSHSPRIRSTLV